MSKCGLEWRVAGWCRVPEAAILQGGRWRKVRIPARFAKIRHPVHGTVLFDTGYAPRFLDATAAFPYRIYRWLTPVELGPTAREQTPEEVTLVILSHFHADHMGGLLDFPEARLMASRAGYESVRGLSGVAALRRGFLPDLLPADFERRATLLESGQSFDVFGDDSCRLLFLPGHAPGQMAALVHTTRGAALLAADVCWHTLALTEDRDVPWWMHALLTDNLGQYRESLAFLREFHRLHPEIPILPCHCPMSKETLSL